MKKLTKAQNEKINQKRAEREEQKKSAYEVKKENTEDALMDLCGINDSVQVVRTETVKAKDFYDRVYGVNHDIYVPDCQREGKTCKQEFVNKFVSGILSGMKEIHDITVAIFNNKYYLVDGLQRTSSYYCVYNGEIPFYVVKKDEKLKGLLGVYYSMPEDAKGNIMEMPDYCKERFENFTFRVKYVKCDSQEQLSELFIATNTSTPVNKKEKISTYADPTVQKAVSTLMKKYKDEIGRKLIMRQKQQVLDGGDRTNLRSLIQQFFLMCVEPEKFTGNTRIGCSIIDFETDASRKTLSPETIEKAYKLFDKCMSMMDRLDIVKGKQNIVTYRVAWILFMNIIANDEELYFTVENAYTKALDSMMALPTTSDRSAQLTRIFSHVDYLYKKRITPYIDNYKQELIAGIVASATSTDDGSDDDSVA